MPPRFDACSNAQCRRRPPRAALRPGRTPVTAVRQEILLFAAHAAHWHRRGKANHSRIISREVLRVCCAAHGARFYGCRLFLSAIRFPAHSGRSPTLHVTARCGHSRFLITAAEASSTGRHFALRTRMSHSFRSARAWLASLDRRHFANHPTWYLVLATWPRKGIRRKPHMRENGKMKSEK